MTEQEFKELEMKLWRELGEQRKREREQERELKSVFYTVKSN